MRILFLTCVLALLCAAPAFGAADVCVECHAKTTPKIVSDWKNSAHSGVGTDCATCHGSEHTTAEDSHEAALATPETCRQCHPQRVEEFSNGKHALGWKSYKAMPTTHWQPMTLRTGLQGCSGCHKIGLKSEEELQELREAGSTYGAGSCDSCHTRHLFSKKEAQSPQACRTCHMGMDHPQWEMYSSSKHGVRYKLVQEGSLPEDAAAPTCQTCHMEGGDHAVMTGWGFLGVRLPMPDDEEWAEDRATVLKGLGVLDPQGNPTDRLEVVKQAKVARLTEEAFRKEREEMVKVCSQCHQESYARAELRRGDDMIRIADDLLAESIRVVAGLYEDGILKKPDSYKYAYPDLLTFHDAPTEIETRLWLMFLKHRMRTFQGAFHINPDYALWYGWSEMVRDNNYIEQRAEELRRRARVDKLLEQ
ncbi:multiheme c-type cytochrome [Desulfohalovibrio reitneri]|uniref:multiheme c-type cytochrome n=1 Tax=Desulfohalovibrio reitneri TaxID=1307759 RepID=UPI0004A6CB83|nr:multiheme c-type cytochrome [Desulfohalovibrio reitneri]